MRVLVANMPGLRRDADGVMRHVAKAGARWPMTQIYDNDPAFQTILFPFWLAYMSALLKRDTKATVKGVDGVVLEFTAPRMQRYVEDYKPDVIITELATLTADEDLALLAQMKEATGATIAVCGGYATSKAPELLAEHPAVDFVMIGEYEFTARELVNALIEKRSTDKVLGLVSRGADGSIIQGPRRPLIHDLNELPFPDREDFPAAKYHDFAFHSPCITMMMSRGCPATCGYCVERHVIYASPKYRIRKAEDVVDEMQMCIEKYGAKQFYFDDMSFVVNKKYVTAVCDEIIRRGIVIPWTVMGDAMFSDKATLTKMKEAGCFGMKFGIESANPEILKVVGKPLNLDRAREVTEWCHELGIRTHVNFVIGLPGETKETIENTMRYAESLDCHSTQVARCVPYPGTPIYHWAKENGYLVTEDPRAYDGNGKAVLNLPGISNFELDEKFDEFIRRMDRRKARRFIRKPKEGWFMFTSKMGSVGPLKTSKSLVRSLKSAI